MIRRACKPNLWTLPTEPEFNAAGGMLFRTMISFGFLACCGCQTAVNSRSGRKMELFRATASKQGSE
jgi:hypothetical protein